MNRRDFVRLAAGAAGTTAFAESLASVHVAAQQPVNPNRNGVPARKALMKVGTQHGDSEAILQACAAFGVNNICSRLPSATLDDAWSVAGLSRLKERVESFGIALDMVPLPLSSSEISRSENPGILLANADRDRQIDDICQMIRNAARAGIFQAKYNLTLIGIPRTAPTPGRGPSTVQHVRLCRRATGSAAHRSRPGRRGHLLGAHHLLSRSRRPGRRGVQGPPGLPPAGSRHAEGPRLARRGDGARIG